MGDHVVALLQPVFLKLLLCCSAVAGYQTACARGCPAAVAGSQTALLSKGRANMQQQQHQQQQLQQHRGRQDHLFFDLKSNQSLDLFLLILDLRSIF
jgi:hypothetical protein